MDTAMGILGPTALWIDGRPLEDWGKPKERCMLAPMLVYPRHRFEQAKLIRWIWPDDDPPPDNPANALHTYATRIRNSLKQLPVKAVLKKSNGGYQLDVDPMAIDLHRFRAKLTEARGVARTGDHERVADLADQAIRVWRGRALDDLSTAPAHDCRSTLENEWIGANITLLEALLKLGEHDEVLTRLDGLQFDRGHNVAMAKLRTSAFYGLARFAEGDAYFMATRRALRDEGDQLAADHLRAHHESLRAQAENRYTASTPPPVDGPRHLPYDIPGFVGREDLLAELDSAVTATPRVVILDGEPGVGKTALVVHWAHRARDQFPDGAIYVDLNGFSERAMMTHAAVVDEFLAALGHPPDASSTPRGRELLLGTLLAGRRPLVVLDNARGTEQVRSLIPLLSGAFVVVTSRQRLSTLSRETGAHRVRVAPFTAAEADRLLAVRLRTRHDLSRLDRDRIARICAGLPLAISVLAERVAQLPPGAVAEFAGRLDHRHLLVDLGDDGDGSTIARASFAWSYLALEPTERRLFRLLALHPGPDVGVEAINACDGRDRAATGLSLRRLVGAHLLDQPVAIDRYRFHDLIREFGALLAERDEPRSNRSAAERRMYSFYLTSAYAANRALYPSKLGAPEIPAEPGTTPLTFGDPAAAMAWFDTERANLAIATRAAADRGHPDYGWRLPHAALTYFTRAGHFEDRLATLAIAVDSAKADGDLEAEASSLFELGEVRMVLGDYAAASEHLQAALRKAEDTGSTRGQAVTSHKLGELEVRRGDLEAGLVLYERGLDFARASEDTEGMCWAYCDIGRTQRAVGRLDMAEINLRNAHFTAERTGDRSALAVAKSELGAVFRERESLPVAVHLCTEALEIAEEIRDLPVAAAVCHTLAEVHRDRDDLGQALRCAERAVELFAQVRDTAGEIDALDLYGDLCLTITDHDGAAAAWQRAAERCDRVADKARGAAVLTKLAVVRPAVSLPHARTEGSSGRVTASAPQDPKVARKGQTPPV
ncbi:MAG TPA: tetratricopeptide repeat protein [Actinokineospora sp.]|nr:tetratricopeptide repeat protein [Actinokineospora sp.]